MANYFERLMKRRRAAELTARQRMTAKDVRKAKAEAYLSRLAHVGMDIDASRLNTAVGMDEEADGSLNISFSGPIDNDFFSPVNPVGELNELSNLINKRKSINKIDLSINSPGGDMMVAMGLANAIRAKAAQGTEVITRATGMVASAATLIYLAGDTRYYAPGAEFMTHAPSLGVMLWDTVNSSTLSRLREDLDLVEKVLASAEDAAISYYADRLGRTTDEASDMIAEEHFWTRDEVFADGVATEDGPGPKLSGDVKNLLSPKPECKKENSPTPADSRLRAQIEYQAMRAAMERVS